MKLSLVQFALIALLGIGSAAPAANARPFIDSHACRGVVEGVMKGDPDAMIAAINPNPSDVEKLRDGMARMAGAFEGFFKGKTPRLERTLPDISVENYPVSLQIWSFGDKEVYFVGCLMGIIGREPKVYMHIHPFVDEVVKNLKARIDKSE
ncbi:hypothetical protein [Microvirga puerhi]|uniref:Uncharacterized protein n=1 Tax=Microvirga puerhi TaxID=2876078 RepID=A0ABS7VIV1_9HYPH|nr:hypothetical protein [Microvirga puerhi]MBZ6075426.1 hypothetical protein [Microvirga puerhi]